MKKILFLLLILSSCATAQTLVGRQQVTTLATGGDPATTQALVWLPNDYSSGKTYPVLFIFPGVGDQGKTPSQLVIGTGTNPFVQIANGWSPNFIVVTTSGPANSWGWNSPHISRFIDQINVLYHTDPNRIYLSGYSAGGWGIQQAFTDPTLSNKVAAVALLSPASTVASGDVNIAQGHVATWLICGGQPDAHTMDASNVRTNMQSVGGAPLFTSLNITHDAVASTAYDTLWKGAAAGTLNIYGWFLSQSKQATQITHTFQVPSGATHFDANPGDTLEFNGSYTYFYNTTNGIAGKPIVMHMKNATFTQGFDFKHAQHFHIYGDGTDSSNYTFKIHCNGTGTALSFQDSCQDIEVDHFSVINPMYFVWWKHTANCNDLINTGNQDGFYVHDGYCDSAHQDGFYISSTDEGNKTPITCNGAQVYPKEWTSSNVHLANIVIKNVQRNGINYSLNIGGANNIIDHVTIKNCGYEYSITHDPAALYQGAGIATGSYVNGLTISNCVIKNTFLPNIVCRAGGHVNIFNNILDSADRVWGITNSQLNAAMQISASDQYPTLWNIYNNTIGWSNNGTKIVLYGSALLNFDTSCVDLPIGSQNQTGSNIQSCSAVKPPVDTSVLYFTADFTGKSVTFHRADGSTVTYTGVERCIASLLKKFWRVIFTNSPDVIVK